jgi:hypothetical protein
LSHQGIDHVFLVKADGSDDLRDVPAAVAVPPPLADGQKRPRAPMA